MFGLWKILRKEKKMLKKIIFSCMNVLRKIPNKIKYD